MLGLYINWLYKIGQDVTNVKEFSTVTRRQELHAVDSLYNNFPTCSPQIIYIYIYVYIYIIYEFSSFNLYLKRAYY